MATIRQKLSQMNPLLKGVIYFIGGLLILLIILQILITLFADDYAANYLKDKVNNNPESAYTIDFDDLDLSVFRGSANIANLRLDADTSAFADTSSGKQPPKSLITGTVGELDISGINVFSALWGEKISIGTITLNNPDIRIRRNPNPVQPDTSSRSASIDSTIYTSISKRYQALEIGEIDVNEAHILYSLQQDTLSRLGRLNLTLNDIRVDSASARSGRRFPTQTMSVNASDFSYKLKDSLNTVKFTGLSVSSQDQTIEFDSLRLVPRYARFEYSRKNGSRSDRLDLDIPKLRIEGFDFATYVDSGKTRASYVEINDVRMVDFLNKAYPGGPPETKPLPFSSFKNSSQPIKIDSLKINNGYISYSEYLNKAPKAGTVTFERLNASMYNISNYPSDIARGITTTLDVRTWVMGTGLLNVHYEFPMDSNNDFHTIKGRLDAMAMPDFNPMLEYAAFVSLDSGQIHSMEFNMTLNDDRSNGDLVMQYEELEISVLDKSSIQQKGLLPNLMSFVANNFIVRESNTPEGGMKPGRIQFERNKDKSVFNYWWKSLLSGIKDTIKR